MNNKGFFRRNKKKNVFLFFSRNKNVTIIKKENGFILSSPKTLSTIRMNNLTYEILMLCNGKIICYLFLIQYAINMMCRKKNRSRYS